MTDATITRRTLDDIAQQATTDPTKLAPAEITRLADWYLDHEEHVLAHGRLIAATTNRDLVAERRAARATALSAEGAGDVTKRLTAVDAAGDTTEHAT